MDKATLTSELFLERHIHQDILSLDRLCQEFRETREDLTLFLTDYYSKVGGYIASLESLHAGAPAPTARCTADTATAAGPSRWMHLCAARESAGLSATTSLQQELRTLYLLLVKKTHPDTAPGGGDVALLAVINHAYEQRHLGSLWKIMFELEWKEIRRLPLGMRRKLLDHYQQRLRHAVEVMENDLRRLHASPEYQLFQRIFTARLRGEDLLGEIVDCFQEEISKQSRRLEYRRFRHQLMQEIC